MSAAPSVPSTHNATGHDGSIVYVVDDDAAVRRALATLMRSVDLLVETFSSPEEFLQRPRSQVPSCLS